MDRSEFEHLVDEAVADLPDEFRDRMANLAIVVEDWPDADTLRKAGVRGHRQLLGFYHGVPLPRRGRGYTMVTPDRISIYRLPILRVCRTDEEVRQTVARVVRHEVAHHFGIDDRRLLEIDAY